MQQMRQCLLPQSPPPLPLQQLTQPPRPLRALQQRPQNLRQRSAFSSRVEEQRGRVRFQCLLPQALAGLAAPPPRQRLLATPSSSRPVQRRCQSGMTHHWRPQRSAAVRRSSTKAQHAPQQLHRGRRSARLGWRLQRTQPCQGWVMLRQQTQMRRYCRCQRRPPNGRPSWQTMPRGWAQRWVECRRNTGSG